MSGHRTNIEDHAHPWPHHRATCSCGWRGPNRLDRYDACRDEGSHWADQAVDEIVERIKRTEGK